MLLVGLFKLHFCANCYSSNKQNGEMEGHRFNSSLSPLPSPSAFFASFVTEWVHITILEPGTSCLLDCQALIEIHAFNFIWRAMWLNGGTSDLFFTPQASVNSLQGFLNCLIYRQHKPFTACCTHIFGHCCQENDPHCPPHDLEERNNALTMYSLSESVEIPVSEISQLLTGGSERGTTPLRTSPVQSPDKPFTARLLGESRYSS